MTVPRQRKPHSPVVVRPSFVSQDSSPALLGLSPRKFLEVLVSPPFALGPSFTGITGTRARPDRAARNWRLSPPTR
jgi:hypothetical protein